MDEILRTTDWNVTAMDRGLFVDIYNLNWYRYWGSSLKYLVFLGLEMMGYFYYPILAIIGFPGKPISFYKPGQSCATYRNAESASHLMTRFSPAMGMVCLSHMPRF